MDRKPGGFAGFWLRVLWGVQEKEKWQVQCWTCCILAVELATGYVVVEALNMGDFIWGERSLPRIELSRKAIVTE